MSENRKFHGIVRFNAAAEVVCFCSYDEYLKKGCACREQFDCPEAMIEITVIPGTKPSDQALESVRKVGRDIKRISKSFNSTKKALSRLERDMKRSPIK